jgi:RNA polymerase sigma factor (sigma-70 family)
MAQPETHLVKLIKKASQGHRQSQIALYESYYGYCMSVALRFSDNRENAKEIVHDAFLKAFAKLDTVLNAKSFKPWLRRIVVNVSIDYYRKHRAEMHHLDVVEHDVAEISEDALSKLSVETIYYAIAKLPSAYRMVFTLFAIEGYKHEEIGGKLGISVGTSKSNLSKARKKLKKIIADMDDYRAFGNG